MPSKFGPQPGRQVLVSQGRTVSAVARILGISEAHLLKALSGLIRPNHQVRRVLPDFLGVPLEELFTEDALKPPVTRLESELADVS